jgi:peptidyl-prolyl cis-trans isomerase C
MTQLAMLSSVRGLRSYAVFFLSVGFCLASASAANTDNTKQEQAASPKSARSLSKPWYMETISPMFPVSPATIVILGASVLYLLLNWTKPPTTYCEASHILIQDHTDASRETLEKTKESIKNNPVLFKKNAVDISSCPSKTQGGFLGRFHKNDMAPPFDRVCFDPATPLEATVGPIETQFGYHLIWIHSRKLE